VLRPGVSARYTTWIGARRQGVRDVQVTVTVSPAGDATAPLLSGCAASGMAGCAAGTIASGQTRVLAVRITVSPGARPGPLALTVRAVGRPAAATATSTAVIDPAPAGTSPQGPVSPALPVLPGRAGSPPGVSSLFPVVRPAAVAARRSRRAARVRARPVADVGTAAPPLAASQVTGLSALALALASLLASEARRIGWWRWLRRRTRSSQSSHRANTSS